MRLATGCTPLDELLGGGLEPGAITLVYGEAGTGKTNLCIQAAVHAARQGPGKVGYVDTEGVSLERLEQIAGDDYHDILRSILFYSPQSLQEQEKMIASLAKIRDPPLVVVDSLNMYYRLLLGDDGKVASQSITRQLGSLLLLARSTDVPVLITGQVYTGEDAVHPFGGRIMEHIVKTMVHLERVGTGERRATLYKHRSRPEGAQALFRITAAGIA
jgi:DNA repair protein RadB